jgi:hypothetical protein
MTKKVGSNFGEFRIDFLGEYEAICETASARESEPYTVPKATDDFVINNEIMHRFWDSVGGMV